MKSILVIHIYFGKFPKFFNFWLKSCEYNYDIDFLIVTDNNVISSSKNIIVHRCTLNDIKVRAEGLLGFPVSLDSPRKLCDYKPLYGLLMNEYASKYDFWGYCDSDLIFGKIRNFITEEILSNYDYILGMGHFHIQRTNDPNFDCVWKSARGVGQNAFYNPDFDAARFKELDNGMQWRQVFTSPENQIFDELPYGVSARYYQLFPNKFWSGYSIFGRCFDDVDFRPLYLRDIFNFYDAYPESAYAQLAYLFPFYNRTSKGNSEVDAVIYEKNESGLYKIGLDKKRELVRNECLYAHFLHRTMHVSTQNLNFYLICPNKFVDYEEVTPKKIEKWRDNKWLQIERLYQDVLFQINRGKTLWKKIQKLWN